MQFYVYDLETYRTCFTFCGKFEGATEHQIFEISNRVNQRDQLMQWLSYLQNSGAYMVGYNNLGFDYPILHHLLNEPYTFDALTAYNLAQQIISQSYGVNNHMVYLKDRIIPQIDLVKINHFDNVNKRTRLKDLQFAMRSESVEDLPFDPASDLSSEQIDQLKAYNLHDVTETERFLQKCKHLISMRKELLDNGVISGDVLNFSDVKIGTELLIKRIGRQKCFLSGSRPRQTFRREVPLKSVILPKIQYRTEPFNEVLEWYRKQTIYLQSEERPKLEKTLAGLQFFFGVGGVHASVENRVFKTTDTHVIKDIDVSGMYPAVAIANGFYPEHLGQDFVTAYKQLQADRAQYPKGTTMNAVLKLAGNGVYGNSNNAYSCFYDPKYMLSITINGQLQLLQLAESLSHIPGLQLIQANTDGITALVPRDLEHLFHLWTADWESSTGLKLEEVNYGGMWISNVNHYVAVTTDGKVKRKGLYWYPTKDSEYEGWWNKDFSNMSAQKGVEQVMLYGVKPEDVIKAISDPFDFMLRYKTPQGSKVYVGDKEQLKTVRYYVSTAGKPMLKRSPARGPVGEYKRNRTATDADYNRITSEIGRGVWDERIHTKNKSKYAEVVTAIESGRLVKVCNNAKDFNWSDVDWDYYISEIKKLVIG